MLDGSAAVCEAGRRRFTLGQVQTARRAPRHRDGSSHAPPYEVGIAVMLTLVGITACAHASAQPHRLT